MAEYRTVGESWVNQPLRALILTDGKMGDLAQCRGVADALRAEITEITVQPGVLAALLGPVRSDKAFAKAISTISSVPDLVLASGGHTAAYMKAVKRQWGDDTLTVFLKDPRTGAQTADFLWVPTHDPLRGSNVITTDTGPHGHTRERRVKAASDLRARLARLPRPWLGILLGGKTKKVPYDDLTIETLADAARMAAKSAGSVLITASRRTPAALTDALADIHPHTWIWDEAGENPYTGILGASDALLVTGDSHNMVSEALSAGRQTMVFRPRGLPSKFIRFLDKLEADGHTVPPGRSNFLHTQPSIDATPLIAEAIKERLEQHKQSAG